MTGSRKNQETPKFENPNYSNARGKAATDSNQNKVEHENPDTNPGHVQESSRPKQDKVVGGWDPKVVRKLIVKPIEDGSNYDQEIEPHGIKRI